MSWCAFMSSVSWRVGVLFLVVIAYSMFSVLKLYADVRDEYCGPWVTDTDPQQMEDCKELKVLVDTTITKMLNVGKLTFVLMAVGLNIAVIWHSIITFAKWWREWQNTRRVHDLESTKVVKV